MLLMFFRRLFGWKAVRVRLYRLYVRPLVHGYVVLAVSRALFWCFVFISPLSRLWSLAIRRGRSGGEERRQGDVVTEALLRCVPADVFSLAERWRWFRVPCWSWENVMS